MSEGSATGPRSKVFWARWGFFIVAGVLGALLVVSTVTSYLGSRQLLGALESGQRVAVEQSLGTNIPRRQQDATPEVLQSAFEAAEPLGLRYMAVIDRDTKIIWESGEPFERISEYQDGEEHVGDRLRSIGPIHLSPPRRGEHPERERSRGDRTGPQGELGEHHPARPGGERPPHLRHQRPGRGESRAGAPRRRGFGPRPRYVIEVETSYAHELEIRSARDATIGLGVSVALIVGAFFFGRLATRSERMIEELRNQRELASLGEMSAVLAHELRNPLASIKGNAELLAEGLAGDQRRGAQAKRVYEAAARLERLTENLLDFVRAGKVNRAESAPKLLCRHAAHASGVEDVIIDDLGAPEVWNLDEDRMMQALLNLLRNAGQASGEAGPVELRVAYEGGLLVFEIRDHGEGVADEDRERIFEPFVTTRTRGTGLGLAVVRRVAELHGGRVDVRTHPDGGAVFRLEIART